VDSKGMHFRDWVEAVIEVKRPVEASENRLFQL
jgi:hypothetical protein